MIAHGQESGRDGADPALTAGGQFKDPDLEREFRRATWPVTLRITGRVCALSALVYGAAGLGPVLEFGFTPKVTWLTAARLLVALAGVLVLAATRSKASDRLVPVAFGAYFAAMGLYEAAEAVLLYTPDLEYSVPFTLLIILLMYLLIPLLFRPVAVIAVLCSVLYVAALAAFAVPHWMNCIQLALFFVFANAVGAYVFLQRAQWRRLQFFALRRIGLLNRRLEEEVQYKEAANQALARLAVTDELTGAPNRRKFMQAATAEWSRARRYGHALSLLILDLDHFKQVNDSLGHQAGDHVLVQVAEGLQAALRGSDFMGRLGGEEFGILLPETDDDQALQVAERIRQGVAALEFPALPGFQGVTVSIGVARMDQGDRDWEDLFRRADQALYQAKDRGRDRSELDHGSQG